MHGSAYDPHKHLKRAGIRTVGSYNARKKKMNGNNGGEKRP
jgi:hypothetical protein